MAKTNTNENGAGAATVPAITPTIHLVLQGKGGIGKSVVAGWLAEFLTGRGQPVRCIDGDPVNRSLWQYKALDVEKLDLLNQEGLVMRSRYDRLIDRFLNDEAVFVLDSGATAFLPFWTYIVESDIIAILRGAGRRVYVHIPISGGEMLNDTLLGFKTLAETAAEKSLVVWINEFFGPVALFFRVKDEDEAIALANDSDFGLGGSVFTKDVARGKRVASRIDTGMMFINNIDWTDAELPFGGIKNSGYGRELGDMGIQEFVNKKLVRYVSAEAPM